jgi:hypothetical protein
MTYGSPQVKDRATPSGKHRFVSFRSEHRWPRSLWWVSRPDAASGVATMLDVFGNRNLVDKRRLYWGYDRAALELDARITALDFRRALREVLDDRDDLPEQQTLFEDVPKVRS